MTKLRYILSPVCMLVFTSMSAGQCFTWEQVGPTLDGYVHDVTYFNGEIIAGGNFKPAFGLTANAAMSLHGSTWKPLGGIKGTIWDLANFRGEIVATGQFTMPGYSGSHVIARWNGVSWRPLGHGVNGRVVSMREFDGDLIVGGTFDHAGGVAAANVARWDGASWHPMGNGLTRPYYSTRVIALAVYRNQLYAGGGFFDGGYANPL